MGTVQWPEPESRTAENPQLQRVRHHLGLALAEPVCPGYMFAAVDSTRRQRRWCPSEPSRSLGSVRRLCLIVLSHPAEGSAVPRFISGAKGPHCVSDCQFGISAKPIPLGAIIGAGLVRLAVGS